MEYYGNHTVNKDDIKRKLKDKRESINNDMIELNKYLAWAIEKEHIDIIDMILRRSRFEVDIDYIKPKHLIYLFNYDHYNAFKKLYDKVKYDKFSTFPNDTYQLMKNVSLNNKSEYLRLLISIPNINFSNFNNSIIKKAFHNGYYENVQLLLERPEIQKDKELVDKYNKLFRNKKLYEIKNKIIEN